MCFYNRSMDLDEREAKIRERGTRLLEAVDPERLITLSPAWWQEQLMEWAASDAEFRVKLLRFVDVLPALRTRGTVADHVRQYFREDAPPAVRLGSALASTRVFRPVLSRVVRRGVFTMADRFIGGATEKEVLPRLKALVEAGTGYTIDLLGEATLSEEEGDGYASRYAALVAELSKLPGVPGTVTSPNISVKLSALTPHFEPAAPEATSEAVRARLLPLLRKARDAGVFVNVDMEQYRYKDLVHRVFADVATSAEFRAWDRFGIVVQAYQPEATDDISLIKSLAQQRGTPITVRLVKGAYWDEEVVLARQHSHLVPVFTDKAATDLNYERCTGELLSAYPDLRPAFASHNPRTIAQAMVRIEEAGLPLADVEFQMLYGMAEGLRKAVATMGYATRVYVPSGAIIPGMAYLVRRLLENTSNDAWLMHRHEEADPKVALVTPKPAPPPATTTLRFMNHPPAEFYRPEHREAMAAALARARGRFGQPITSTVSRSGTRRFVSECPPSMPATVMARVEQCDAADATAAVDAAVAAFPAWRDRPASERAAILRKAAAILDERRWELAATETFECGKPWVEADADVCEAIDFLRYYALQAEDLARGVDLSPAPGETNHLSYEGRGVAAVIGPWNFPLAIPAGMTSGALAAGCTVVLKPAEQSPGISSRLVDILHEAGVPLGAVQFVPGPGETVGKALVDDPRTAVIAFTGSNAVGREIALAAARIGPRQKHVKKLIAELGGKNAIIVDDDADLDVAVAETIHSAFAYAGQKCSAASRVYVVGTAYPEFRTRLASAVRCLVVGPPDDPFTEVPPVISEEAMARIDRYAEQAASAGKLVAEAPIPARDGWYVAPRVFEGVPADSPVAREEVFGPLLLIDQVGSFQEGLERALDSDFALTGGIFSRNPRNIAEATRRLRVGNLYINRSITGSLVGRQPFGGFAMSGTGDRAGGPGYVEAFTVSRVVTENTMRRGFAPEI